MIERLTKEQIPLAIAGLADIAVAQSMIPKVDKDAFLFHWEKIMDMQVGAIFARLEDGKCLGALGCTLAANFYTGETEAHEAFFYVRPEHRDDLTARELLDAYDEWAKENDAVLQVITRHFTSEGPRLDKLYRRRGYKQSEVSYSRSVNESEREKVA